jgi:4-amino-4-deoxy-L-arabinose transferase-like glycosyltransferase
VNASLFQRIGGGALAAAVAYLCFFHGLDAVGLVGPDEPRYASIARAMATTGDWVTPRLNGQPWFEKPVLYYWSAAVAFRLFGVSDLSARLPSAAMALLVTLVLAWLARREAGDRAALAAALIFPTTIGGIGFSRAATTDMLFAGWLTMALGAATVILVPCAAGACDSEASGRALRLWKFVAWGASLGLATLAKGPVALALASGGIALWALATQRWRDAFRLLHPTGLAAFALVALPWYVLCGARNPDFVQVFFISHNLDRFLTPVFRHEQPFWFFAPILALGLLPWTLLLFSPLRNAVRAWRTGAWRGSPALLWACWAAFSLVFFSASKSKLPGYMLPLIPPLVLLIARSIARADDGQAGRWWWVVVGATLAGLGLSADYWHTRLPPDPLAGSVVSVAPWAAGVVLGGLVISGLGFFRRPRLALGLCALLVASIVLLMTAVFLPKLDAQLSTRTAAQFLAQQERRGQPLAGHWLHRAWQYGFDFYLGHELAPWTPAAGENCLIVITDTGIQDLLAQGYTVRLVRRIALQATIVRVDRRPLVTAAAP